MRIKTKTNVALQSLAVIVHMLQQAQSIVPEEYGIYLHTAVGLLQLVVGVLAHFSNPDATPVVVPYVKPEKKRKG